jgi:CCR4-NOT transcriptional regulation complex NOT5 subunit
MKKEIKKLQRQRDWFKQNMNNPDIKDKSKLLEAKRKIENVKYFS